MSVRCGVRLGRPLRFIFCGTLGLLGLCLAGAAHADTTDADKARDTAAKLQAIQAEETAKAQRQDELKKNAVAAAKDLAAINAQLVALAADERGLENKVDDLSDQLADLVASSADQTKAWEATRADYVTLWRALVRFAETPDMALLGAPGAPLDAARGLALMQDLLGRLKDRAKALQAQYADMMATQKALEQKRADLKQEQAELQDRQTALHKLMDQRNQILAETTDEQKKLAAQMAELAKQATTLQQLLAEISSRSVAIQPGQKVGTLILPIAGTLTQRFKQRDEYGVVSEGITLAGTSNAVIVAPAAGKVVFTGPFKGYGNLVILEHTGGWHSLMAGFGRIDAHLNAMVAAGEPLGLLPESTQNAKVNLYFELRHGDEPVDPLTAARQGRIKSGAHAAHHSQEQ